MSSTLDRVFAWACAHGADAIVMLGSQWGQEDHIVTYIYSALFEKSLRKHFRETPCRPPFAVNMGGFLHPRHCTENIEIS